MALIITLVDLSPADRNRPKINIQIALHTHTHAEREIYEKAGKRQPCL